MALRHCNSAWQTNAAMEQYISVNPLIYKMYLPTFAVPLLGVKFLKHLIENKKQCQPFNN